VVIVDLHLFAFAEDDRFRVCILQQFQHFGIVVIAADHKAVDAAPGEPRLGKFDPRSQPLAGEVVEQALDGRLVGLNCPVLVLVHDLAVVAERSKTILEALKVGNIGLLGATGTVLEDSLIKLRDLIDREHPALRLSTGMAKPPQA